MASRTGPEVRPLSHGVTGFKWPLWGKSHNSDSNIESPWSRKIILALDGGGVRGYASLYILKKLMEEVQHGEGNAEAHKGPKELCSASYSWNMEREDQGANAIPTAWRSKFLPHHYIDYFVGTSTGGLTAIMLGRLQMDVTEALRNYDYVGAEVFQKPRTVTRFGPMRPHFKTRYMEKALQRATQQDVVQRINSPRSVDVSTDGDGDFKARADKVHLRTESADVARTVVVAMGGYKVKRVSLFRSYDHAIPHDPNDMKKHKNAGPASDLPLWQVARATSAAPGYFSKVEVAKVVYQDGAVAGYNNPVELAFEEVRQMHWRHQPLLIISIGTGQRPETEQRNGYLHRMTPQNMSNLWDAVNGFKKNILDSHRQHEKFLERYIENPNAGLRETDYFRFDVSPGHGSREITDIKLGEWKGTNGATTKMEIENAVDAWLDDRDAGGQSPRDRLRECAVIMVKCRMERAQTERWERKALHLMYCCSEEGCKAPPFESRGELRSHALSDHGFVRQVRSVRPDDSVVAEWSCYWDHCGEEQISAFDDVRDFLNHLHELHGLADPRVKDVDDFERWLSNCRQLKPPPASRSATARTRANTGLSQH